MLKSIRRVHCVVCGALGVDLHAVTERLGIAAPVGRFLPRAAELLRSRAVVPEHADVANAIVARRRRAEMTSRPHVATGG